MRESEALELQAYHDEELSRLRRWRMRRRLARDPHLARELRALAELSDRLREFEEPTPPGPDLWPEVRRRLPDREPTIAPPWSLWKPGLAAGLAAAVGLALVVGIGGGRPAAESVRWLDARGSALMVLQDDAEATIIWVPGPEPDELSYEERHAVG